MIDGDSLATFLAIAEARSFSRAAEKLGIAQSVVSKRLRRLEDQLSAALVDRSVRTDVKLTRIGRLFRPHAIDTLARLESAERSGRNLGRGKSGPLRIGFVFSAAMNGTLTAALRALRDELPELVSKPELMDTLEQLKALESGELDVGFLRPRPSYPANCEARVIHSEPLVIGLSVRNPLAANDTLLPEQLAGQRFIVPQFHEKIGLIDNIRQLAKVGGFDMPEVVQTNDFVTAACLAASGEDVVVAPASLMKLKLDGLRYVDILKFPDRLETVFVHHVEAPIEAVRAILALFSGAV